MRQSVPRDDPDQEGPFLVFPGGQCIPIDGPLRVSRLPDGWYVIGHGSTVPCGSEAAARNALRHLIKELDPNVLAAEVLDRLDFALPEVDPG